MRKGRAVGYLRVPCRQLGGPIVQNAPGRVSRCAVDYLRASPEIQQPKKGFCGAECEGFESLHFAEKKTGWPE